MEILFLVLALGCGAFLAKILLDYAHEIPVWKARIEQANLERDNYESQLQGVVQAKEAASSQSQTMDDEIKNLEQMRDELKVEIEKTKKDMARSGRIVIRRSDGDDATS